MPIPKNFVPSVRRKDVLKQLPKKMWKLIDVAVADVESVIASDNVSLNMDSYAFANRESRHLKCTVCLAGSVMIGSLGLNREVFERDCDPNDLCDDEIISENSRVALNALEYIRKGRYIRALEEFYYDEMTIIPEHKWEKVKAATVIEFNGHLKKSGQERLIRHLKYLSCIFKSLGL